MSSKDDMINKEEENNYLSVYSLFTRILGCSAVAERPLHPGNQGRGENTLHNPYQSARGFL